MKGLCQKCFESNIEIKISKGGFYCSGCSNEDEGKLKSV